MRRVKAWTGLSAGILLLAVAASGWWRASAVEEFGAAAPPPDMAETAATASPDPAGGRPLGPATSMAAADPDHLEPAEASAGDRHRPLVPGITTRSARLADLDDAPTPDSLELERLGITAPIDPVGLRPGGALEIPSDVQRAGWFRHGAHPGGSSGSSVIAAHVDGPDGPGVFYDLRRVQEGDRVRVAIADERLDYEVTAFARYGKGELPTRDLFRGSGPHRLVLITCGGAFDEATRTYAENVVVIAEPSP